MADLQSCVSFRGTVPLFYKSDDYVVLIWF